MVSLELDTGRYNARINWEEFVWAGVGEGSVRCYIKIVVFFYFLWIYFCFDVFVVDKDTE